MKHLKKYFLYEKVRQHILKEVATSYNPSFIKHQKQLFEKLYKNKKYIILGRFV